jgi:hypothetical protein
MHPSHRQLIIDHQARQLTIDQAVQVLFSCSHDATIFKESVHTTALHRLCYRRIASGYQDIIMRPKITQGKVIFD